jgi:hypothetical protein
MGVMTLPMIASAQSMTPIKVTEKQSHASDLDRKAASYEDSDWSQIGTAAKLREQAAALRGDDDVLKAASLYWAARDHYYAANTQAARDLMARSAHQALDIGDVIGAATAFTDAAFISAELHDVASTKFYAMKARMLAASPMLTSTQRDDMLQRLASGGLTEARVASLGLKR